MRRGRLLGTAFAVLLVLLGGCSEPSAKGPSTSLPSAPTEGPSTVAPSSSRSEQLDPERQAVVDAYKGFFDTVFTLQFPSDEQVAAALSPFGDTQMVQHWISVFQQLAVQVLKPGGYVTYGPMSVSINGDKAQIDECRDGTTTFLVEQATGAIVNRGTPNSRFVSDLVRGPAGQWLVSTSNGTANGC